MIGVAALAIVLAVVAVGRWLTQGRTSEAYLDIQSNPGAQLLVDDNVVGIRE